MTISIGCKEVGMDCYFVTDGESVEAAMDSFMRHVEAEHSDGWFEIEEIYQAASQILRERVA